MRRTAKLSGLLLWALLPALRVEAADPNACRATEAWVEAFVMYFGEGTWGLLLCPDGVIRPFAHDLPITSRITSAQRTALSQLLKALPRDRNKYQFGTAHIDLPNLELRVREDGREWWYFVGDDVEGEKDNPLFLRVARLAVFLRGLFTSSSALDFSKWFSPLGPQGGLLREHRAGEQADAPDEVRAGNDTAALAGDPQCYPDPRSDAGD